MADRPLAKRLLMVRRPGTDLQKWGPKAELFIRAVFQPALCEGRIREIHAHILTHLVTNAFIKLIIMILNCKTNTIKQFFGYFKYFTSDLRGPF